MDEKILVLAVFIVSFALILYRKIPIYWVSLAAAGLLIAAGVIPLETALTRSISWDALALYFGYGILAVALERSNLPKAIADLVVPKLRHEKYALLFLCTLAAGLSSFMPNPVVVLMLAPLAIEIAERMKSSLFLYLIGLAISSNVVTTVSMVADPPSIILAMTTGMSFTDFYWLAGRPGLGTLSAAGVAAALLTLVFLTHGWRKAIIEYDRQTIFFLIGIFIVIGSVDRVGLLGDFADWLTGSGFTNPLLLFTLIPWLSVALSSFIDNVPYTVLMIPVCGYLAQQVGVNPFYFYFGMLVGTGIGGNITPVGATANVLACGMLEKRGIPIDIRKYMKLSVPFSVTAVLTVQILVQIFWSR